LLNWTINYFKVLTWALLFLFQKSFWQQYLKGAKKSYGELQFWTFKFVNLYSSDSQPFFARVLLSRKKKTHVPLCKSFKAFSVFFFINNLKLMKIWRTLEISHVPQVGNRWYTPSEFRLGNYEEVRQRFTKVISNFYF